MNQNYKVKGYMVDKEGKAFMFAPYEDNKENGPGIYWAENSKHFSISKFKNGLFTGPTFMYANGEVSLSSFENHKRTGSFISFSYSEQDAIYIGFVKDEITTGKVYVIHPKTNKIDLLEYENNQIVKECGSIRYELGMERFRFSIQDAIPKNLLTDAIGPFSYTFPSGNSYDFFGKKLYDGSPTGYCAQMRDQNTFLANFENGKKYGLGARYTESVDELTILNFNHPKGYPYLRYSGYESLIEICWENSQGGFNSIAFSRFGDLMYQSYAGNWALLDSASLSDMFK